jgi:hypothetical protein
LPEHFQSENAPAAGNAPGTHCPHRLIFIVIFYNNLLDILMQGGVRRKKVW